MTNAQDFAKNLFQLMEETFEAKHHGIYLDKGTSLFETLETISATRWLSRAISPANLAVSSSLSSRSWRASSASASP